MVPGIEMPIVSTSISQVFSGTQEDSWHMHQLAKREISNQKTHKKEMNIEEQVYSLRRHGLETQHGHDPFLHLH
jgi:hypothetical protein